MRSNLLQADGKPAFGVFSGEIGDISLAEYQIPGFWNLSGFLKKARTKRWRFVGFFSEDIVAGIAVVDAGYIGSTFSYAFDIKEGKLYEYRAQSPFGKAVSISDHATSGSAIFTKGDNRISMLYEADKSSRVDVDAQVEDGRLQIEAFLDESFEAATPHQITTPTPQGSFAFTHKTAGLPAHGKITVAGKTFILEEGKAFAAVDCTAGYHDYHWVWHWSSFGGLAKDGRRVGLNLVAPVHHPTITENAMWIENKRVVLSEARSEFDKKDVLKPWHISTIDGHVDLEFRPLGERAESLNAGIFNSHFHQPIGTYHGTLKDEDGSILELDGVRGVAEDHDAHW